MKIRILLRGPIARYLDSTEMEYEVSEGSKITDVMHILLREKKLKETWQSVDEMNREALILHNEVDIELLEGLNTPLQDKDNITILPLIHGG
ncbi:MAG: hypothetical protein BAJATHORv1_20614 [Candidatus Thorarchaeota archaeon]|nr:MAG: hypothetical protein BAJATHORv1_20614 [Candidatus Thorarchaeota archaeon]